MFKKLGVQLYTIRDFMKTEEDIRASFAKLKAIGYDEGQTAGCAIPHEDFGRLAKEADFTICGTHESFAAFIEDPEKAMANHRALATTNMGSGGMPGYGFESLEGLERFIKEANELAEIIYPHGFKFTYHNHHREFKKFGNDTIMEILAKGLDPKKTSFCLDTHWVQRGGGDVRHWMEYLAGRIDILHLKDMSFNGKDPLICEIGNGNLWWDGIIKTAEDIGVKYYVVEQDTCPGDPFDSLKFSADYLAKYMK